MAWFRKMHQKLDESIMQYYVRLRQEVSKCEFHDTELEIKRHLQETILNSKLAKKSIRDKYTLQKFLEEAQVEEESKTTEVIIEREVARNDDNINNVQAGKYSSRSNHANHFRFSAKGNAQGDKVTKELSRIVEGAGKNNGGRMSRFR